MGGYSAEVLAAAIQKVIESESNGSDENDLAKEKKENVTEEEEEIVTPITQDIPSLLTPADLKYLQTQLRLTRTLGRTSPASIDSILRSMKLSM